MSEGQQFGGAWTELKLDAVHHYLRFYTDVLKDQPSAINPFELWYIDAFAGSGSRRVNRETGGIFEGEPLGQETVDLAGSVLRALDVQPPFKRLIFIEENRARHQALQRIAEAHPLRNVRPILGDANTRLREIFGEVPWSSQNQNLGSHRAVVFLDPFGMSVKWDTLKMLADTCAVDVWYLFPTGAVNRQLANNLDRVDQHKQRALDEAFGSSDWQTDIYIKEDALGLFSGLHEISSKKFTVQDIENYAQQRLKTIFGYVSDPLPLLNNRDTKIFSLFCLSNSPSNNAIGLIMRGVRSVLKNYG